MATYKEIKGTQIESLASDPSNPVEGQVWYNSTSNVLKGLKVLATGSWATGGSINDGRSIMGAAGTGNSTGLIFGGAPPSTANTESYNGTNWTEVADLATARKELAGAGVNNSGGLAISGAAPSYTAVTEEWSGAGSPQVRTISTD